MVCSTDCRPSRHRPAIRSKPTCSAGWHKPVSISPTTFRDSHVWPSSTRSRCWSTCRTDLPDSLGGEELDQAITALWNDSQAFYDYVNNSPLDDIESLERAHDLLTAVSARPSPRPVDTRRSAGPLRSCGNRSPVFLAAPRTRRFAGGNTGIERPEPGSACSGPGRPHFSPPPGANRRQPAGRPDRHTRCCRPRPPRTRCLDRGSHRHACSPPEFLPASFPRPVAGRSPEFIPRCPAQPVAR